MSKGCGESKATEGKVEKQHKKKMADIKGITTEKE